jgi:enoyl-CoA hydratase/carnithine racemase
MAELILSERDGAILTITLNMPEKRNPVSDQAVVDELCDAFQAADADLSVRCVILTGAGSAFSSGGDLKAMKAGMACALPCPHRRGAITKRASRNFH